MIALAGLDLNGLWDHAETWEPEEDAVISKDAGVNGSVIRLVCAPETLIGGRQAALAPHGRGGGWGQHLGGPELRMSVAKILEAITVGTDSAVHRDALVALTDGLAGEARLVVAVPDAASFDEAARERLLRTLDAARAPQTTLLWRPIAAILGWLVSEESAVALKDGCRLAVISLMRSELHIGDARMIAHQTGSGVLWTPERSRSGLVAQEGGISAVHMAEAFARTVAPELGIKPQDVLSQTQSPWDYAVGSYMPGELVRLWDRSWRRMPEPASIPMSLEPSDVVNEAARARLRDADIILVEGPACGNDDLIRSNLESLGQSLSDQRVRIVDPRASARGCLEAARRMGRGDPVYFDFLPQIEINALVRDEPAFVPLIPKDARIAGGKLYQRKANASFAIGRGATGLTFYLLKEFNQGDGSFEAPRKSEVELPEEALTTHPIEVTVEQSPGQGFARVRIRSHTYMPFRTSPLELDWSRMEMVDGSRETLLQMLGEQTGSAYPDVSTVPGHPILWHPAHPSGSLLPQLESYLAEDLFRERVENTEIRTALQTVRERLARAANPNFLGRRMGLDIEETSPHRPIGTDGALPAQLPSLPMPPDAAEYIDLALEKAAAEFEQITDRFGAFADASLLGDLVGFATWCFWRCPANLTNQLLEVYAGRLPFTINPTLLVEGLGRVVHEPRATEQFFTLVEARLATQSTLRTYEYGALIRILGTAEDAAERLPDNLAQACLADACALIDAENRAARTGAYKRKFKSALLMLAVLLRHRRRSPDFATPQSREGEDLLGHLDLAATRMHEFAEAFQLDAARARDGRTRASYLAAAARLERLCQIVVELEYFVRLEGRDPNIIRKIDEIADE